MPRWSGFMLLVVVLFSALRASGQAAHARDGADLVVVVADPTHGPQLSQLFRAVLQARLPEVDVRFVPESTWDDTTKRPAATLVFRLDTSRDSVWILRLVEGDRAWQRQLHGVAQDPAAIEAAALIAARASMALLTRESDESEESPEELTAWTPKEVTAPRAAEPGVPSSREPAPSAPASNQQAPEHDAGPPHERAGTNRLGELRIQGAYRGAPYAKEVPWAHGAYLALAARLRAGPCALLGYTYVPSVDVHSEFGDFDIARYPAEFQAGWCFRRGSFGVSPKLGVLMETTRRSAARPRSGVGASSPSTSIGWAAVTGLSGDWRASESLALFLGASAAYFPSDLEYVAAGLESPIFSPYKVQLRVDVGAQFAVF